MARADRRWNHNTHYYPLVLAAVPDGCRRALDVGCGEGMLARELAVRVPQVVGIDEDEPSIALAREQGPAGRVEYVLGDFLGYPFPAASFGLISCVAALHHMDPAAALTRMSGLLAPGGALVVSGVARSRWFDLPLDAVAVIANLGYRAARATGSTRRRSSGRRRTPTGRSGPWPGISCPASATAVTCCGATRSPGTGPWRETRA
jgi:SAM-dependent methyltransferase